MQPSHPAPRLNTNWRLELQAPLELEGARIVAGLVHCAESGTGWIDDDFLVANQVAEGDVVGYVQAIHAEDELDAFGDVEGAVEGSRQAVDVWTAEAIGRDASGVSDGAGLRVAEGADAGCASNWG